MGVVHAWWRAHQWVHGGHEMSHARKRIAAAQAVLSVILLLVVYLTLLRPDSDSDMLAVEARQGQDVTANGVFASRGEPGSSAQGVRSTVSSLGGPPSSPASAADRFAPGGPGDARPGGPTGPPGQDPKDPPPGGGEDGFPTGNPPPGDGGEDSPTDDQYADAVSRLLGRVATAD